jgi:hypothetical protein
MSSYSLSEGDTGHNFYDDLGRIARYVFEYAWGAAYVENFTYDSNGAQSVAKEYYEPEDWDGV